MESGWRQSYQRYKSYFLNVVSQYQKRADIKVYLEILLSLATISILAIFAIRPTFITIAELLKEIEGKEKTLATMEEKVENLKKAQNVYNNNIAEIDLLNIAIPDSPSVDVLTRQIEGLSAKHQINVSSINSDGAVLSSTDGAEKNSQAKDMPEGTAGVIFSINTDASFPALSGFLKDMEILRRPVKFNIISVRNLVTQEGETIVLNIEAKVPFFINSPNQ
jgi:hypothetical protein